MRAIILVFVIVLTSCDKIIEIPSNDSFLQGKDIQGNKEYLLSYASSVYSDFYLFFNSAQSNSSRLNIGVILGAMADEFEKSADFGSNVEVQNAFNNSYLETSGNEYLISAFFVEHLKLVIKCNSILELIESEKQHDFIQLGYEVRTMRAIIYYYLMHVYKDLPLLLVSSVDENFKTGFSSKETIVNFFIKEMESIFPNIEEQNRKVDFSKADWHYTEKINKNVVAYYLSKYCLIAKDFSESIRYSRHLIEKYSFNVPFKEKFLLTSSENIWILNPSFPLPGSITLSTNVPNASFLNYKNASSALPFLPARPFSLNSALVDGMNAVSDKRRVSFIDSVLHNNEWKYLPSKYKVSGGFSLASTERFAIIRLPLVYFNLVEALHLAGQHEEAVRYYNLMAANNYTEEGQVSELTIDRIVGERFKETFGELGDRWITLKRNNMLDSVMTGYLPIKSNGQYTWNPATMAYFPLPMQQLLLNPNLK